MRFASLLIAIAMAAPAAAQEWSEARSAIQQGRWSDGERLLGEPSDEAGLYLLGRAQVELKKTDQAEATFKRILESNDNSSLGHEGMARVYNARKDYTRALQSATRSVQLNGDNAGGHYILGVIYAFRKDTPRAIESLRRSVELENGDAYAHYHLGLLQYQQKKFDQTIIHFERFIELAPNAPEAGQVGSILRTVRG
jgi:tetratricopeptide (TPR) repeat protein